ncbi:hypothetical protein CIB84_003338, partial [Bambusicola thoracicus]
DVDHQKADWVSIHEKICQLLIPVRTSLPSLTSEERKHRVEQLVKRQVYLATSAFGLKSVEASGGYFHMANVFFCQNKMDIANSLYAEVTDIWHTFLVKSVQTQEQIHKSRAEKSPFTEDKEVEVSEDTMSSCYDFTSLLKANQHNYRLDEKISVNGFEYIILYTYIQQGYFILDAAEAQQAEAIQVLNAVLDIREKAPKQQPEETARVLHALAMLYYLILDLSKAYETGMKAFDLLKQLPQQESLEAIGYLLKLIDSQPSCPK